MKQINVWFEEKEHEELIDAKNSLGKINWHDFIMKLKDKKILKIIEENK